MTRREQIKQMIREVVAKHLPEKSYTLFIFGSQANKLELIRSDIDIGIDAGQKLPYHIMGKIHADLEEMPTLYFYDFIDFQTVNERFKSVALSNIEVL
jgi:predicted nucleotidyltransferase